MSRWRVSRGRVSRWMGCCARLWTRLKMQMLLVVSQCSCQFAQRQTLRRSHVPHWPTNCSHLLAWRHQLLLPPGKRVGKRVAEARGAQDLGKKRERDVPTGFVHLTDVLIALVFEGAALGRKGKGPGKKK